jgi:hypothetical protein
MAEATDEQVVAAVLEVLATLPVRNVAQVTSRAVTANLALKTLTTTVGKIAEAKDYVKGMPAADSTLSLASPLVKLFIANSKSFPPMRRWDVGLYQKIDQAIMSTPWPIQEAMLTRLMTVLSHLETQQRLGTCSANGTTVKQFITLSPEKQLDIINRLWNESTDRGSYSTPQDEMYDRDNPVELGGTAHLPDSVHPVRQGGARNVVAMRKGRDGLPFRRLGVGFRVEGSGDADRLKWHVNRVLTGGMRAQVTLNDLMLANGFNVEGTIVSTDTLAPRLNKTQKDLWNESGVCVARSFLGATAFPYRWTEGDVLVWAVDVRGLNGFDTERYQVDNKGYGSGPWRPGEKCFGRIEANRILGWVIVSKLGFTGQNVGWKFSVPADASWGGIGNGTAEQRSYMVEELAAWRDTDVTVPTEYDFVSALG